MEFFAYIYLLVARFAQCRLRRDVPRLRNILCQKLRLIIAAAKAPLCADGNISDRVKFAAQFLRDRLREICREYPRSGAAAGEFQRTNAAAHHVLVVKYHSTGMVPNFS